MLDSDTFVWLDDVQFSKNGVQNRNVIKTPSGEAWLTLPVRHKSDQLIRDVEIAKPKAAAKHFRTIQGSYAKSEGYRRWKDELEVLFAEPTDSLLDICERTTRWMLDKLGSTTRLIRSSSLDTGESTGSERVARICREVGATTYLTGTGALDYLDMRDFEAAECNVQVQTWQPLEYKQVHPEAGFVADLSALDLLLNRPDEAAHLIRRSGGWTPPPSDTAP